MRRIPLTQGLFAIVDDKDFDFLNQWNWWVCRKANTCYAVRKERLENGKWRGIRMHRLIMNAPEGLEIHHTNHNGLDNRRENLRICTHSQNQQAQEKTANPTTSRYKGVSLDRNKVAKPWKVQIRVNGKLIRPGHYRTQIEAARAYDEKATQYFGEFALTNF